MTQRTNVLLSYRRADAASVTGRMFDRLAARYGRTAVFMDIDSIPYGRDFRDHIRDSLRACGVVLVIIGPRWTGPREGALPRIHDADDPVRLEVEIAFAEGVHVVPVLVEGAAMPAGSELPASLQPLSTLNGARVDSGVDFHVHLTRLEQLIDAATGRDANSSPVMAMDAAVGRLSSTGTRWLWASVYALVLALPIALSMARLSPPWPPGVVVMTMLVAAGALVLGAQLLRVATLSRQRRVMVSAAAGLIVAGVLYLVTVSVFTYEVPTTHDRFVRGYACTAEAALLFKEKCPNLGIDELQTAEYEAERLWTGGSIAVVKVTIVVLWLVGFLTIALLVTSLRVRYVHRVLQASPGGA